VPQQENEQHRKKRVKPEGAKKFQKHSPSNEHMLPPFSIPAIILQFSINS
jgi:hypothetical protein